MEHKKPSSLDGYLAEFYHAFWNWIKQYGFIKGRIIQDCLVWAFQFLHVCHHPKKEIVILKLDFEKVFDVVEHEMIGLKAYCP
jgi:hypothetical protein